MAAHLARADHDVLGFLTWPERRSRVRSCRDGRSPVITMLPDRRIVRAVDDDIVKVAVPGSCLIDDSKRRGMTRTLGMLVSQKPVRSRAWRRRGPERWAASIGAFVLGRCRRQRDDIHGMAW